jgi:hypothetical protein
MGEELYEETTLCDDMMDQTVGLRQQHKCKRIEDDFGIESLFFSFEGSHVELLCT